MMTIIFFGKVVKYGEWLFATMEAVVARSIGRSDYRSVGRSVGRSVADACVVDGSVDRNVVIWGKPEAGGVPPQRARLLPVGQ